MVEIRKEYHKNSITSQKGQLLGRLCIKELWKRKKFTNEIFWKKMKSSQSCIGSIVGLIFYLFKHKIQNEEFQKNDKLFSIFLCFSSPTGNEGSGVGQGSAPGSSSLDRLSFIVESLATTCTTTTAPTNTSTAWLEIVFFLKNLKNKKYFENWNLYSLDRNARIVY